MFHSAHPKKSYVQKDSSLSISLHVIDVTYSDFFCDNKCLFFCKIKYFFHICDITKNGGLMKKFILLLVCLGMGILSSCSKDDLPCGETSKAIPEVYSDDLASVHSMVLNCAKEIIVENNLVANDLTEAQLYAVTESAVLRGVQNYVAKKEGRNLTSTEQNTLKKEVNVYWYDNTNRSLMKKFSQSSSPISPTTGNTDLKALYKNFEIEPEAQVYFNKMLANIDSPNCEMILDQLYMDVWSNGIEFTNEEKQGIMNVIAVTKDSYKYWNNHFGIPKLSNTAKGIILSDASGALRGLWKGIGRSLGSLVFGPGDAVLTVGGSVLVNAAAASVEAGIIAGLGTYGNAAMNDNYSFDFELIGLIMFSLLPISIVLLKINKHVKSYLQRHLLLDSIVTCFLPISIWFIGNEFVKWWISMIIALLITYSVDKIVEGKTKKQ